MTQKIVTFKVAKAIKEAGYPQKKLTTKVYLVNCDKEGELAHYTSALYYDCVVVPTYIEVWLWLWREKKNEIDIQVLSRRGGGGRVRVFPDYFKLSKVFELNDPEEAIAKAIEYLVENNLIK